MRTIISLLALFLTVNMTAQGDRFQEAMGQAMAGYGTSETPADFDALSLRFKRIADAEPTQWLPLYYQAHAAIIGNFSSTEDAATRDMRLDQAQRAIDKMLLLVPKESEAMVLQGLLYTGKLVVDPATRGKEYGMKSAQAIGKALGMNPANPRALYMSIANEQGSASFFGKDLQPYCDQAKELLDRWDDLNKPATPLDPSWGKEQVAGIAHSCD